MLQIVEGEKRGYNMTSGGAGSAERSVHAAPKPVELNGLSVLTPAEIDAQSIEAYESARPVVGDTALDMLAGFVKQKYDEAKQARDNSGVTEKLLRGLRRRSNEYDADIQSSIRQSGLSDIYVSLTKSKCNAAEAWMTDIQSAAGDKGWTLAPTTKPDLPVAIDVITANVVSEMLLQDLNAGNEPPSVEELSAFVEMKRKELTELHEKEAKEGAQFAKKVIKDQLDESGWNLKQRDFRSDCVTFGTAFIKGPIVEIKKRPKWVNGRIEAVEEPILSMTIPSPLDMYLSPCADDQDNGYVVERQLVDRTVLESMLGRKFYNEPAIRMLLEGAGSISPTDTDLSRMKPEQKDFMSVHQTDRYEILEFWGSVSGEMLRGYGVEDIDPIRSEQVQVIVCNGKTLKAMRNPHPLGRDPYHRAVFKRTKGSPWGDGVPELMRSSQDIANGAIRALINNMGISSGPQCMVDRAQIPAGQDITNQYPFKLWITDSSLLERQSGVSAPVQYFYPPSNAGELMNIFHNAKEMANEESGIPSYTYGMDNARGAGETASGLAMLLNASGRGIKDSFANMDIAVAGMIEDFYFYDLVFPQQGRELRGDCHVVTSGTIGVLVEEVRQAQIREFMQILSSPMVLQLLGPMPMLEAMRQYSELLKVDVDGLLPSKDEIERIIAERQQAENEARMAQAHGQQAKDMAKATRDKAMAEKAITEAGINKANAVKQLSGTARPQNGGQQPQLQQSSVGGAFVR